VSGTRDSAPSVAALLGRRVRERPDAAAFIDGSSGARLTWRDLDAHAQRWRSAARDAGLPARSRIGLVAAEPLPFIAAYIGALGAGMTAVPLDARAPFAQNASIAERVRVDVLAAADAALHDGAAPWAAWHIDAARPANLTANAAPRTGTAWPSNGAAIRPAVLLSSSGTSGAPKTVPLGEAQLLGAASRIVQHHRLGASDRGYTPLPLFHVNAQVVGLLATLVSGGSLVVDARFVRDEYWDRVAAWGPTWLNTVPAVLAALTELPVPAGDSARRAIRFARSASAPLPLAVHARFQAHTGIGILETYGATEAAGQICANPLDVRLRRPGSVGLPTGIEVAILDDQGYPVAVGEDGLVHLGGPAVVDHYVDADAGGRETLRTARESNGWWRSGDVGHLDESGFLHLAGRADDVINRGGEKFHPLDVESVLLQHAGVATAAVVAVPHARLGQVPVAFVVPGAQATASLADELRRLSDGALPRHMRPVEIRVALRLPVGPTGKVHRRELARTWAAA
jgi:acyl-CoA synthetase (AMP-forming)/AMP-acid ligase II